MEQSALNSLIAGGFAPLSPRYNFMGDFLLLDLEEKTATDRAPFRQQPEAMGVRPLARRGALRPRLQAMVRRFALADWPTPSEPTLARRRKPEKTPARRRFAERLVEFLKTQRFIDQT